MADLGEIAIQAFRTGLAAIQHRDLAIGHGELCTQAHGDVRQRDSLLSEDLIVSDQPIPFRHHLLRTSHGMPEEQHRIR